MKRTAVYDTSCKKRCPTAAADMTVRCVASSVTHQGDAKFKGNGIQCTAMACVASAFSVVKNRSHLSVEDFDVILSSGDDLYIALEPFIPPHVRSRYLSADELPTEIRVGQNFVQIENVADNWIVNGLYPDCETNKDIAILALKNILDNMVFNNSSYNDNTDSIIFTGQDYTVCFWRFNGHFYLFNSHAVNTLNKSCTNGVARFFECNTSKTLAELLLNYKCAFDGSQYSLSKIRVTNYLSVDDIVESPVEIPDNAQFVLQNLDTPPVQTVNTSSQNFMSSCVSITSTQAMSVESTNDSLSILKNFISPSVINITQIITSNKSTEDSPSILKNYISPSVNVTQTKLVESTQNSPSILENFVSPSAINQMLVTSKKSSQSVLKNSTLVKKQKNITTTFKSNSAQINIDKKLTTLKPVVVMKDVGDYKLSLLKPVVVIEPLVTNSSTSSVKRGRPKKVKRGTKTIKENAHLDAVIKYNLKNPQISKESSKRYVENHPEVHRAAVKKYDETNPEIHRAAAKKYDETHPEIHKKAAKKYDETHPEIHKKAAKKYDETHPEIHKNAAKKYDETHPETHRAAVKTYTKNRPEVNRQTSKNYTVNHPEIAHQTATQYNVNSRNIDIPLRRSRNLIGEKRNEELNAVKPFALKKASLNSPNIHICPHCNTRLFDEEKSRVKWCCGTGAYNVQNLNPLTEEFYTHPSFLKRPRAYNNIFAFSALGVSHGYQQPEGLAFLKIQGRIYHRVFDLSYNQTTNNIGLYINDPSERESLAAGQNLDLQVTRSITNFLHNVNPHIDCFKRLSLEPSSEAFIQFERTSRATHGNILGDQPVGREVSAIISTDREQFKPRCIAIWKVGLSKPHTIDIMHLLYESFQYPLLYPEGNAGWFPGKLDNNGNKLTQVKYVRCLLLSEDRFSLFGRLSEEWLIDMYCRISEERLRYLQNMQTKNSSNELRAAPLQELFNDETMDGIVPGRIYLPNTFTGGPRYMKVKYLDCIALVDRLGPPSYFVTFTCNPNWPEIKQSIPSGQRADPLICARVFNLRLTALIRDLRSGLWFGKVEYLTYVIEFQKRGLPHAHICFRVEGGGPVQNLDIDKVCRADIPDESEADGRLRKAVVDHMIHGPCGPERDNLPCYDKEKQKCSKRFPKCETDITFCDEKGFIHLRRNSSNEAIMKYRGREIKVNDLWVVPYNAALLLKYDAHINVEISSQRSVIKYLFKYMTKGPDEARVAIVAEEHNEIEDYVTKRYIGSSDAAWRVLEFDVTAREPNVKQLSVHLKNQQTVIFRPSNTDDAIARGSSDLITYFNRPPGENFDNLSYVDFYEKFIVHSKRPATKNVEIYETANNKFITRRQRGEIVARLFWVAPNRGEQFYLRLLLKSRPCRSYEDLLSLGGLDCTTFQDAAKVVGLADDQVEYEGAMLEASTFFTGPRLRKFFVLLAVNGAPVASLWDTFKKQLSEDILLRFPSEEEKAYNLCLVLINRLLGKHGATLAQYGLPEAQDDTTELGRERVEYDINAQRSFIDEWLPQLSPDQRVVFEYIDKLYTDKPYRDANPCAIFVDGPAGTGKTLLLNAITAHVRGNSGIVLCTASSAIAAQNYEGGVTAHSMFKYPLEFVDDSGYWNITNRTQRAELIYHTDVIIYDEAPMAHKYLIHLLDRSLRDLMNTDKIFGGKIVIFAGDFRQIPPVVPNARSNSDILNCSVKTSPLWQKLKTFSLTTSQRCRDDPEYAEFLLQLGSNQLPTQPLLTGRNVQRLVSLESIETVSELGELIDFVFPWVVLDEPDVCAHRAILCTRNDAVREINSAILQRVPGEMQHFYSFDKIESENADQLYFGPDALNRIQPPGVPEHDLKLKERCVCMITRNLSFADGLVNGTKVIVTATSPRLIIVRKRGGFENFLIPRILFKAPIEKNSPFEMSRRQFPLQVSYAMTIHKSQGQTISRVGVDLRSDIFTHGQLYVALGRVQEKRNIKILMHQDRVVNDIPYAINVVIPELLI